MITKQNITLAYELALKNYKNKPFTFMQIWKDLVKKCKFDEEEQKNISQFYVDMLQDKRFIFIGNKKWKIREFLKRDEIIKLEAQLLPYVLKSVLEDKIFDIVDFLNGNKTHNCGGCGGCHKCGE